MLTPLFSVGLVIETNTYKRNVLKQMMIDINLKTLWRSQAQKKLLIVSLKLSTDVFRFKPQFSKIEHIMLRK